MVRWLMGGVIILALGWMVLARTDFGRMQSAFGSSISFWGKAVDETGKPIDNALIYFSAADKYFKDGSEYHSKSDSAGMFSISGIKGAGLYVDVQKEGYYRIPDKSYGSFAYGMPSGQERPTKDNPAIFVLKKKGNAEPMVKKEIDLGDIQLPRNGSTLGYKILTHEIIGKGGGDLLVTTSIDDLPRFDGPQKFDWEKRLRVMMSFVPK